MGVHKLTALSEVGLFVELCDMDESPAWCFEAINKVMSIAKLQVERNGPYDVSFMGHIFHDTAEVVVYEQAEEAD